MRRFTFALERALRYKEQREQLADWQYRLAVNAQNACDAQIAQLRRRLDEFAIALAGKLGQPLILPQWLAGYRQSEQLGQELTAAEKQRVHLAQQAAQAWIQRRKAAQEAEVLRQLRQRRLTEHQHEAAAQEQITLEDLAMKRWRPAESDDEGSS